ncbi:hypothetical protein DFH09DRAFT_1163249 [Mycena vulgaris]|nr:hypothetical protein DFH09DRAFT_1163249 [Mycena vulgaris]
MLRSRAYQLAFVPRAPPLILTLRLHTRPTPDTPPKTPAPPPKDARKQHIQLRPAPIKLPTPPPAAAPPLPPTSSASPPTVHTTESLSLKSLKETTTRDISDAESHGILLPPPPGAGWAKSTLHKVIQLGKFYIRGVKLVWTRQKITRAIKKRVAAGGAPLERWEHRLLPTQSSDMKRLVPFIVIALILEEVIPLIVLYAPGMLPTTCLLPSQRDRIQEKGTDKVLALMTKERPVLQALTQAADGGVLPVASLQTRDIKTICGLLRLPTGGLQRLRLQRLQLHLSFVEKDDAFLMKEDLGGLSSQDLLQALHERGIITRDLDTEAQLKQLKWWLKAVNEKENSVARRLYLVALMGTAQ